MKCKHALTTFAMLCLFSLCVVAQSTVADHRFEVGAHVTAIDLSPIETLIDSPIGPLRVEGLDVTTTGFGGRFGYNVNDYVGVEAEVNYLPKKNFNEVFQSRRAQVFAGVKVGGRWEKFGAFVKARPGAMHFSEVPFHTVCGQNPNSFSCQESSQTNFALDIGGIVEFYPSSRFIVRIDAGDTIINFPQSGPTNLGTSTAFTPGATTHNLQIGIGFGYRF
jgi:hypothetical protein